MKKFRKEELHFIGCLKGISQYEVKGSVCSLILELSDKYYLSQSKDLKSYNENIASRISKCYGSGYKDTDCLGEQVEVLNLKTRKMRGYEYPLKDKDGTYTGYYSIKAEAKPVGFNGEKLVSEFEIEVKDR